jgi:hypothetical protein
MNNALSNTTNHITIKKVSELPDSRKRIPLSSKIINQIKKDVDNIPRSKLKKNNFSNDLFWGGVPKKIQDSLPALVYNMPIIYDDSLFSYKSQRGLMECERPTAYLNQPFDNINRSCICVDKNTNRILWVFIKGSDDPAISYCLKHAKDIIELDDKYLKLKSKDFYSQHFFRGAKKIPYIEKKDKPKTDSRYTGKNWLDGLQKYLDGHKGHQVIAYYPMSMEGQNDEYYRYIQARLYALLYAIEKRYSPQTAQYRLELAENAGMVSSQPNLPLNLNPSTSMGSSIDFCSSYHSDSSIRGTLETIIWKGAKKKSLFVNGYSGHYFNLMDDCMILQVGTDYHGTAPTGLHGGLGFVNLTKKLLVADTPYSHKWYSLWKKYLAKS